MYVKLNKWTNIFAFREPFHEVWKNIFYLFLWISKFHRSSSCMFFEITTETGKIFESHRWSYFLHIQLLIQYQQILYFHYHAVVNPFSSCLARSHLDDRRKILWSDAKFVGIPNNLSRLTIIGKKQFTKLLEYLFHSTLLPFWQNLDVFYIIDEKNILYSFRYYIR